LGLVSTKQRLGGTHREIFETVVNAGNPMGLGCIDAVHHVLTSFSGGQNGERENAQNHDLHGWTRAVLM
jgi:hypothetical protein